MASTISMSIENKIGCLWITLPDAISMYNNRELEKSIIENLKEHTDIVLDLSMTTHLFSAGLGLIIRIRKAANEKNSSLYLVNVNEKMRVFLTALNLTNVLSIYATDVEFEISRSDFWQKKISDNGVNFIFAAQIENRTYRIHIAGEMIAGAKYDLCENFSPTQDIRNYIFDFSNLELIDKIGAEKLFDIIKKIKLINGKCHSFGAENWLRETIEALGAADFITFYSDESAAINNIGSD